MVPVRPYVSLRLLGYGRSRGFTLIELLITIAIAAILATIAVPSFNEAVLGSKLNSLANNFVASAHLARSEAIKRNAPITLCASSNGSTCTGSWHEGWLVLDDTTVLYTQPAAPDGFRMAGDVAVVIFQATGAGATPATLTVCRAEPTVGAQARTVRVGATGRPSVEKVTGVATCG